VNATLSSIVSINYILCLLDASNNTVTICNIKICSFRLILLGQVNFQRVLIYTFSKHITASVFKHYNVWLMLNTIFLLSI